MTKEELIQNLKALSESNYDIEVGHGQADEWLLEYINDAEVTELFNELEKWYA